MTLNIQHDEEQKEFFIIIDEIKAYARYSIDHELFDILSVQVPKELSGRSLGRALVNFARDFAKEHKLNLKSELTCPFADALVKKDH